MAEYKSRFAKLGFYCCGEKRQFSNGRYVTDKKKEIEILDKLVDAERVDTEQPKKAEPKAEVKVEEKPEPKSAKKSPKKKSSAK